MPGSWRPYSEYDCYHCDDGSDENDNNAQCGVEACRLEIAIITMAE
jgi:hypothetical protein